MSRPLDPRIRSRLREEAADYVLANGLADFSLRPLARALKTSARMLVYHFGSRENLLREILETLRQREDARIDAWWHSGGRARTLTEFLRWFWRRYSSPPAQAPVRLVFEIYAMALRDPKRFPGVLEDPIARWEGLARRSGLEDGSATATLLLAGVRGLLLDLVATGDRARVGRAMKQLETLARPGSRVRSVRRHRRRPLA